MENNIVYDLRGNVGKHLTVYPDKVVIKSKAGIASFFSRQLDRRRKDYLFRGLYRHSIQEKRTHDRICAV